MQLTIDFETPKTRDVTLREIRTATQVRVKIDDLPHLLSDLIGLKIRWSDVQAKHTNVTAKLE